MTDWKLFPKVEARRIAGQLDESFATLAPAYYPLPLPIVVPSCRRSIELAFIYNRRKRNANTPSGNARLAKSVTLVYNTHVSFSSGYRTHRQMFPVKCARCGKDTEVPFEPRGDKPVYCSDCYREVRTQ